MNYKEKTERYLGSRRHLDDALIREVIAENARASGKDSGGAMENGATDAEQQRATAVNFG